MPAATPVQLEDLPKSAIVCDDGRNYSQFRLSLSPRWLVVARDLVLGYVMLAASAGLVVTSIEAAPAWRLAWIVGGAVLLGFSMAYIQLFLHEAAHFNLWPGRRVNDLIANLLIGIWVATDIGEYRRIHWDHHRFLGLPGDTERSYFSSLDARFLLESLFLVSAIRVLLHRRSRIARNTRVGAGKLTPGLRMSAAAVIVHSAVLAICIWLAQPGLAAAWLAGNLLFYPLFGALRQLLEHRDSKASAAIDYSTVPHGKSTRSFKAGPFGTFFGGAGFRLHDIHHFDPELSYTNLPAVDSFLRGCDVAMPLRSARKSYAAVAAELWRR
ncbi:MAG: fatty acid desaturase [Steroidobacteraceae bacterium]